VSVIQIRPYEKGDESAIVELLNTVFKGWHPQLKCSSMDFWRWKYIKNPYTKNFTVLTIDDERVVGCFHGLAQRIKIGEKIYLSSSGTDLAVEEAYRNKGLYKKMRALQRELEKNNVFFHYGVSNNIVLAKINLRKSRFPTLSTICLHEDQRHRPAHKKNQEIILPEEIRLQGPQPIQQTDQYKQNDWCE
jgi:predicted N-acetyltransferase YhbS